MFLLSLFIYLFITVLTYRSPSNSMCDLGEGISRLIKAGKKKKKFGVKLLQLPKYRYVRDNTFMLPSYAKQITQKNRSNGKREEEHLK